MTNGVDPRRWGPLAFVLVCAAGSAQAFSAGAAGYSGKTTGVTCSGCHVGGATPSVSISGPTTLSPGATGDYTLTLSGGPGVRGGMTVAASSPAAVLQGDNVSTKIVAAEVTQNASLAFSGGSAVFSFRMTAPAAPGPITLFGAGNSCNGDLGVGGDGAATTTLVVTVAGGGAPPVVATAAAVSANPVTGRVVGLSVLGADDGGEGALTYTWAVAQAPGTVSFSANGNNAAKTTNASVNRAGSYAFTVTIRDASGSTVSSSVTTTVVATLSSVGVTPPSTTLGALGTQTFTAAVLDQFGLPVTDPPPVTWSVSGGGTISGQGVFTAGDIPGGPFTVSAAAGGKLGNARVTIAPAGAPVFAQPPSASEVLGKTAQLSVLGVDDGGEAALVYTWVSSGPAPVTFSENGNNAAKNTQATFIQAGTYRIALTARDGASLTALSEMDVVVSQKLATVEIAPDTVALEMGAVRQFTANVKDQFGLAFTEQPALQWSVTGGGTIDAVGFFKAFGIAGGPYSVYAAIEGVRGSAQVTVGYEGAATPPSWLVLGEVGCSGAGGSSAPLGLLLLLILLGRREK